MPSLHSTDLSAISVWIALLIAIVGTGAAILTLILIRGRDAKPDR